MLSFITTICKSVIKSITKLECFRTSLICMDFTDLTDTIRIPGHNDEEKDIKVLLSIRKPVIKITDYDGEAATMTAYMCVKYMCYGDSVDYWVNRVLCQRQIRYLRLEFDRDMGVGKWYGDGVKDLSLRLLKGETPYQALNRFFKEPISYHRNLISITYVTNQAFI